MHSTALIRAICGEVHREDDLEKVNELLQLLRAVIQNELEEARLRMEFIRRKYAIAFEQAIDPDIPQREKQ